MTHTLDVGHPEPLAMLLSTATDQAHQGRPCGLPATDISAEIGHIARAGRQDLIAASAHFPELAEFIESVHHAADRRRRACLCASHPDVHPGRRAVCRLLCRPDRPEPAAGRALRAASLRACAQSDTAKAIEIRHSGRVLEGTAGGPISSLEGKRLCHARGASLCPASLISNTIVARPDQFWLILSAPSWHQSPSQILRSCIADLGWEHGNVHGSDWHVSDNWTPAAG